MLGKFRQNFPSKSLVSEFIGINNGVYTVQCRIVGDGLTLNAIASGPTVEDAEDKARDRALKLFFAGEPISITAKRPSDELLTEFKEAIANEPCVLLPDEQPPKKRSPKKKEPEPVETVVETAIAEPKIIESVKHPLPESIEAEVGKNMALSQSIEQSMIDNGLKPAEVISEPIVQPVQESLLVETPQLELVTFNFSEVINKTTQHMARLNWTNEQGKNYLIATYNKKSRQLLTDEELLDFLKYLESQPDPF